jgi:hypothetical protein
MLIAAGCKRKTNPNQNEFLTKLENYRDPPISSPHPKSTFQTTNVRRTRFVLRESSLFA